MNNDISKILIDSGSDMQDCEGNGNDLWAAPQLALAVCDRPWSDLVLTSVMHSGETRGLPAAQADCSPLSCLFGSNGETMGSPPEDWPVFVACVFVLHQVFTQNTPAPLRTGSAHPSNLLRRQRHSVPHEQHVTQSDPLATQRKLLSAMLSPGAAPAPLPCQKLCLLTAASTWREQSVQTVSLRVVLSEVRQPETTYDRCQWSCTSTEWILAHSRHFRH